MPHLQMTRCCAFVLLLLCLTSAGQAQDLADYDYTNLTFRGVGFDVGQIWPDKVSSTQTYTLRLDLGFLGPGVRMAPSLSYWSSAMRTSELERFAAQISELPALRNRSPPVTVTAADLGDIEWSDLTLGLDAHLLWTTPLNIITYVGLGAAAHLLNGQGEFIDNTFVEDLLDSTAAGMAVMAGLEVQPFARLRLYGEARYTLVSDIRYPGVRVGAALMLPPRAAQQ